MGTGFFILSYNYQSFSVLMTTSSQATSILVRIRRMGRTVLSHPHYYTPNSIGRGIKDLCLLMPQKSLEFNDSCTEFEIIQSKNDLNLAPLIFVIVLTISCSPTTNDLGTMIKAYVHYVTHTTCMFCQLCKSASSQLWRVRRMSHI